MNRGTEKNTTVKCINRRVKALGGVALKLPPSIMVGIMDHLVLLPGNKIGFLEAKRPHRGVTAGHQKTLIDHFRKMGIFARVVSGREEVDKALEDLQTWK